MKIKGKLESLEFTSGYNIIYLLCDDGNSIICGAV